MTNPSEPTENPTSPTRLFLSTTEPAANAMYGKKGPFEGIRHVTTAGRFTAWSGDNLYAASGANTYLTGHDGIRIVAGASVSPDDETSASDDESTVNTHSPHDSGIPLVKAGDGGAAFTALSLLGLAQTVRGLLAFPPGPLYSIPNKLRTKCGWWGLPLGLLASPLAAGAGYFYFFKPPFSLFESANLETHAKANSTHTAKGNIQHMALGKFSGTGLLGVSLSTPLMASVSGGVSASLTSPYAVTVSGVKGAAEICSRFGETKVTSYQGKVSVRGTEVNIGMDEDTPPISPADLVGISPAAAWWAALAQKTKVMKATNHVYVRATDGIELKAANLHLNAKPEEDPGRVRLTTSVLNCAADEYAMVNSGSGTLYVSDDVATLMMSRVPNPAHMLLETQRPTLDTLRTSARLVAKQARDAAMASAAVELGADPLGVSPPPADELAEAEAAIESTYRESLAAMEDAFAEAAAEPDILLNSGVQISPEKVVIHAGPTAVTVDVDSGEVRIEQTAGPSPVVAASIDLSGGALTLQAQTTVSIEAGGQSFSFGPAGYSGPAMTELP